MPRNGRSGRRCGSTAPQADRPDQLAASSRLGRVPRPAGRLAGLPLVCSQCAADGTRRALAAAVAAADLRRRRQRGGGGFAAAAARPAAAARQRRRCIGSAGDGAVAGGPRAHLRRHPRGRGANHGRDRLRAGAHVGRRRRRCRSCWRRWPRWRCRGCWSAVTTLPVLTILSLQLVAVRRRWRCCSACRRVRVAPDAAAGAPGDGPSRRHGAVHAARHRADEGPHRHPDLRLAGRALCPHHRRRRHRRARPAGRTGRAPSTR